MSAEDSDGWTLEITHLAGDWDVADEAIVLKAARAALAKAAPEGELELSLALADDPTVQELNQCYRNQDKPTNVLSFENPDDPLPGLPVVLGDVVLARETCAREATEIGVSFSDHLTHLTIHGVLHLLGYDHIDEEDAVEMEALEVKILAEMGIENPYLDNSEPI